MFDTETRAAVAAIAKRIDVPEAALLAVAEVESGGQVFALVNRRHEPLIRFEGHYFDRRLTGAHRAEARAAGLASPKAGAIRNPADQPGRWALLGRAAKIDRVAALESTSWGLGQVMGAHWQALGLESVDALVAMARRNAAGQVALMALFIAHFGLADELRRLDFPAFARGYNGPGAAAAGYPAKMAAAYRRIAGAPPVSAATGMLRMGSTGARVRELQALLVRAGHAVKADGDYGPSTRDAVKAFQAGEGIKADGVAGPETMRRLDRFRQAPEERPGELPATDVAEVRDAAKGLGPVALVVGLRDQVADLSASLLGLESQTADQVANALLAGSSAIGLGLAAWGLWGWWKSRRTIEGDVA